MDVPVDSLYRATGGDLSRSLLHREVLGPNGIGDVASIVFRDRFGCWGFLDLWRSGDDPPFADTELTDTSSARTAGTRNRRTLLARLAGR